MGPDEDRRRDAQAPTSRRGTGGLGPDLHQCRVQPDTNAQSEGDVCVNVAGPLAAGADGGRDLCILDPHRFSPLHALKHRFFSDLLFRRSSAIPEALHYSGGPPLRRSCPGHAPSTSSSERLCCDSVLWPFTRRLPGGTCAASGMPGASARPDLSSRSRTHASWSRPSAPDKARRPRDAHSLKRLRASCHAALVASGG